MKRLAMMAAFGLAAATAPALAQAPAAQLGNGQIVIQGPPLALALEAAQTAVDTCKATGYNVGATVTDAGGGVRVTLAGDGSTVADSNASRRKAVTSAVKKASGAEMEARAKTDKAFAAEIDANKDWLAREGSLLIKVGDKVVGAIGVDGHPHDLKKNVVCAQAGIDKIQSRLK